jgi:hypothetical protein
MTHIRSHLMAALAAAGMFMVAAPAFAQSSSCQEGQKILAERNSLGEQLNKMGKSKDGKKKQLDARAACPVFTKLVSNGEAGLKWMTENKDWCQIPDSVLENFTQAHKQIQTVKGQACQMAAKINEMEKKAKQAAQQQQQQGGARGLLGGGGLTGSYSMPKGAL